MIKILSKFCGYSSLPILLASVALLPPASAQTSNETAEPPAVIANKSIDTADSRSAGRPHDEGFLIGPDDVLAVNVWKEPEISRAVPVRSDGKISLPLVGELQASGQTPKRLEEEIAAKLHSYISEPEVTVIVQEIKSQRINILGQVAKPGSYLLTNTMTVLDSIALAGGFKDFAKKKAVYVLRQKPDGTQVRIPFNYKDAIKGRNPDQNVKLEPRDTVVIP